MKIIESVHEINSYICVTFDLNLCPPKANSGVNYCQNRKFQWSSNSAKSLGVIFCTEKAAFQQILRESADFPANYLSIRKESFIL